MATRTFFDSTTLSPEETAQELAAMSVRELTAYRNILRMPALRSEKTKAHNAMHLAIVERLLSEKA